MSKSSERFEKVALRILKHCFPDMCSSLEASDMPDLQDLSGFIGVEVVQAVAGDRAKSEAFIAKYLNKPLEEIPKEKMDKCEELGTTPLTYNGNLCGSSMAFWSDGENTVRVIKEKSAKLNSGHYAVFKKYGLFIFSDDVDYERIEDIIEIAYGEQLNLPKKFSYLFLYRYNVLYIIDVFEKSAKRKIFSDSEISEFYK